MQNDGPRTDYKGFANWGLGVALKLKCESFSFSLFWHNFFPPYRETEAYGNLF